MHERRAGTAKVRASEGPGRSRLVSGVKGENMKLNENPEQRD